MDKAFESMTQEADPYEKAAQNCAIPCLTTPLKMFSHLKCNSTYSIYFVYILSF
jgi:hypothetical protein